MFRKDHLLKQYFTNLPQITVLAGNWSSTFGMVGLRPLIISVGCSHYVPVDKTTITLEIEAGVRRRELSAGRQFSHQVDEEWLLYLRIVMTCHLEFRPSPRGSSGDCDVKVASSHIFPAVVLESHGRGSCGSRKGGLQKSPTEGQRSLTGPQAN